MIYVRIDLNGFKKLSMGALKLAIEFMASTKSSRSKEALILTSSLSNTENRLSSASSFAYLNLRQKNTQHHRSFPLGAKYCLLV